MHMYFKANATDMGEIKVKRGKKNHLDLGRFISYNGDTGRLNWYKIEYQFGNWIAKRIFNIESNAWSDEECNKFDGTDTNIFPALQPKGTRECGFETNIR